jgi:poly-gamma-glutamate capsule biosynthesis protein CapA/YwtB (metallophosphatase superfamily)
MVDRDCSAPRPHQPDLPQQPRDSIIVAAGGDMIGPVHPMNRLADPRFQAVADLFRNADAGFANQEGAIIDLSRFAGFPAAETGGGYPTRRPSHAVEVKDMGISMVSVANNHATDYGAEGLTETLKHLSQAGVAAGGAGLTEDAARSPVYVQTPKGVMALVATASTFPPSSIPGPAIQAQGTRSKPRPGISALRVRNVRLLPRPLLDDLLHIAGPFATREGAAVRISDQIFKRAEALGTLWEINPSDETAVLSAVDAARARADLVLFAIHAHETAGELDEPPPVPYEPMVLHKANEAPSPDDPRPASFEVDLFHSAVDHGADIAVRTGPHVMGGIEIYKGKAIFYSLGSLFLDFSGQRVFDTPTGETLVVPDSWFDSFVPICEFRSRQLRTIRIHPIAIEPEAGSRSGMPSIAHGERARAILSRLQELSAVFGTEMTVSNETGVIHLPSVQSQA